MTYYSTRKTILNGEPQPATNKYGNRRQMERQYHLFCANANDGEEFAFDVDSIEWGSIELGMIERKVYTKPMPDMTPAPEPEVEGVSE